MERRNFLKALVGGLAASAAVRTWPFRIYSFPTNVKIHSAPGRIDYLDLTHLGTAKMQDIDFYDVGGQCVLPIGRGSGSTWEIGPDGLPLQVNHSHFDQKAAWENIGIVISPSDLIY